MVLNQKILNVPFTHQIGHSWCWAACVEMVLKYYSAADYANTTQCDIVSKYLNKINQNNQLSCGKCMDKNGEITPECDISLSMSEFKDVFDDYKFNFSIKNGAEWDGVVEKIENGHPVIASMKDDENHVIVIQGYMEEDGGQYLVVNDPQNQDKSIRAFNTVCTGEELGDIVFRNALDKNGPTGNLQQKEYQDCQKWYENTVFKIKENNKPTKIKPYSVPIRNIDFIKLITKNAANITTINPILVTLDFDRIDEITLFKGDSTSFGHRKIKCQDTNEWKTLSFFYEKKERVKNIKLNGKNIILDNTNYNFNLSPEIKEVDNKKLKGEYEQIEMLPFVYIFYGFKYQGVGYWFTENDDYLLCYNKNHKIKANRVYKEQTILRILKKKALELTKNKAAQAKRHIEKSFVTY